MSEMSLRSLVKKIPEGDFKTKAEEKIIFLFLIFQKSYLNDDCILLILNSIYYIRDLFSPKEAFSWGIDIPLLPHNKRHFKEGILWRADFQEADFQEADFQEADLQEADLRGADLREANFYGADLHGANLQGANLQDAYLSGANLQGAIGI